MVGPATDDATTMSEFGELPTTKHLKQTPPNAKHKKEARPKVIAPPKKAKKHKAVETIAAPPPHFEKPHPLQFGGNPSSNRPETDQTRASDAAAFAKWQASAAKAAASEETNMNEQEKSGESSDSESYVTFGSPAPKKKQKVLKDGPNDSAEKEEREDATSASIGATASGAQEQKTRCVLKEAPKRRREKIKKKLKKPKKNKEQKKAEFEAEERTKKNTRREEELRQKLRQKLTQGSTLDFRSEMTKALTKAFQSECESPFDL